MISEQDRHLLYQRLEAVLGSAEAATLMEHLPPVGWADVAAKRDLDAQTEFLKRDLEHFAELFRRDLSALDAKFDAKLATLESKLLRAFVFANFGAIATAVSLTYAAVRLAG